MLLTREDAAVRLQSIWRARRVRHALSQGVSDFLLLVNQIEGIQLPSSFTSLLHHLRDPVSVVPDKLSSDVNPPSSPSQNINPLSFGSAHFSLIETPPAGLLHSSHPPGVGVGCDAIDTTCLEPQVAESDPGAVDCFEFPIDDSPQLSADDVVETSPLSGHPLDDHPDFSLSESLELSVDSSSLSGRLGASSIVFTPTSSASAPNTSSTSSDDRSPLSSRAVDSMKGKLSRFQFLLECDRLKKESSSCLE